MPPPDAHEPWTISRLLAWTTDFLAKNAVDEPRLAAEVLLAAAIPCRRIDLYARHAATLDDPTLTKFRESVRRAVRHEPIAYLVGEKEFFSLRFTVTPAVLIPRPETETLVEWAIDHCRQSGLETPSILDIGTGSGCIAIALLVNLAGANAIATDISPAALDVARQNAERHKVTERITFIEATGLSLPPRWCENPFSHPASENPLSHPASENPFHHLAPGNPPKRWCENPLSHQSPGEPSPQVGLSPPQEAIPPAGFDLIVSNPPYIPASEMPTLAPNVRDFEPRSALTDEADGLSLYREIGARAADFLKPTGRVLLEVADGRAAPARQAVESSSRPASELVKSAGLLFLGSKKDRITNQERVISFSRAQTDQTPKETATGLARNPSPFQGEGQG